jgi:DNA-binding transcriptional regulator YiaG
MPNIESVLKSEISRLARKQTRVEVASLKKAVSQQRAQIASLRRELEALQRAVKKASKAGARSIQTVYASEGSGEERALRFRASGLVSHRKRLGLSAADFGKLLGVSGQSVYKWETGEVRPRRSQLEAIAAVRRLGRREALARLSGSE